ncbi:MAG: efflux RND transporter periplasmic adaptor subunit, partial [Spongiibacteraceae bacterium]|nr:efflux RND transporter periplasmic adaptor subunit [Spongiibacteraceae bacterium]
KAGDTLFVIEPERYQVRVQRAEGELKRAQAQHRQAARDWERISKLFETKMVSERERDLARSALELAEADVAVAQAALEDARIEYAYTSVKAPIAGVTSQKELAIGNLVQDQTLLTTIIQLDPLHVQFAVPEADALALRRALRGGEPVSVSLLLADGSRHPHPARIDYTGAAVDPATGTVQVRAVVANPDGDLMPGQFLRIGLVNGAPLPSLVIPASAVTQGPQGPAVFVINNDSVAELRPVTLGPTLADEVVIEQGLQAGEQVVIDGVARIRPEEKVRIVERHSRHDDALASTQRPSANI